MREITYFLLVILLLLLIYQYFFPQSEGFFNRYNRYYKRYCKSCGWRSMRTCANCINCGISVNNEGKYECVPGDKFGPYFRLDTVNWIYDYPYKYYYHPTYNKVYRLKHRFPKYRYPRHRRWRRRNRRHVL